MACEWEGKNPGLRRPLRIAEIGVGSLDDWHAVRCRLLRPHPAGAVVAAHLLHAEPFDLFDDLIELRLPSIEDAQVQAAVVPFASPEGGEGLEPRRGQSADEPVAKMTNKPELVTIFKIVGRFKEEDKANKEHDLIRELGSFIGGEVRIGVAQSYEGRQKRGPSPPVLYVPDTVPFNFWGAVKVVAKDVIANTCRCQWYAHDDIIED